MEPGNEVAKKKQATAAATKAGRRRADLPRSRRDSDEGRFAEHLRELLAQSGLTTAEFAKKIKKSTDVCNMYMQGTRMPPFKHWRKIADALGLSTVNDLLPRLPLAR
jgi:ribosome-binding protein aMBF1 (putative translation factor)